MESSGMRRGKTTVWEASSSTLRTCAVVVSVEQRESSSITRGRRQQLVDPYRHTDALVLSRATYHTVHGRAYVR
eukprot:4423280-Pleurochrysis_carterae.AAC.2